MTNIEKARRGFTNYMLCPLCRQANEDTGHLLCDYFFAQEVWKAIWSADSIDLFLQMDVREWLYRADEFQYN